MADVETTEHRLVHVGRVELVPEPEPVVPWARLRENLVACRFLITAVVLEQVADIVTTIVALSRGGYYETNSVLLTLSHGSEIGAVILKLAAIVAVLTLALARLPVHRARVAVVLALGLSLIGPMVNVLALQGQ